MGIFFETRSAFSDKSDMVESLGVLPFKTVSLSSLDWSNFKALKNSDIWTAVTLLARDIAMLDIKVKEGGVYKDKNRLEYLLNRKPNNFYNGYMLKYIVMMNALLTNHGYIKIERNPNGGVYELYHIKTSNCHLRIDEYSGVYFYEITNGNNIMNVPFEDVIDIKPFSVDGVNGLSVLDALHEDISTQKFTKRFFANFFANGGNSSGLLKIKDGKLNQQARDKLRDEFQRANSGEDNAGKVLVVDSTMDYEQLEINSSLLDVINKNDLPTKAIAKAFQIPLSKFGMEMTNTSMKDVNNDYLKNCLGGYMKTIEAELNFKLINDKDAYTKEFKFDTTTFRQIDWESYIDMLNAQLEKAGITHDEYREAIGRPPYPDGLGAIPRFDLNHISANVADDYQLKATSTNNQAPNPDTTEGGENNE